MSSPAATPRSPAWLHVLYALAALALAAAGVAYAWLWMFSNFQLYDDEGYFLVLVRHLLDGHRIYDEVSTVYGPGWLGYRWILNGVFGAPLSTDGVRWQSLCVWIACAAIAALLARLASRGQVGSRWIALVCFGFALLHLSAFANEPGHPQDFAQLVFLGGLALFLALRERRPSAAALVLGLAVALQGWTKVNLGAFFALPVALLFLAGAWNGLALAAALALPWVLMRTHLSESWGPALAAVIDCGLLAAWLFRVPPSERPRGIVRVAAGVAAGSLVCIGFALLRGSTLAGLWHALVVLPSRFTTEIVLGIRVPGDALFVAPAALLLAGLARWRAQRLPTWVVPVAELAFGVFTLGSIAPHQEWLIPYLLPFSWVVLVQAPTRGVRLPLVLCAALQALQVFPVSGSQEALGTVLLLPLAAIACGDACAALWSAGTYTRARRVVSGGLLAFALYYITALLLTNALGLGRRWRDEQERVKLPGVHWTRFDETSGGRARFLADTLRGFGGAFLGVRGDNSLYAWSGCAPSTGTIVSHSWRLFDERQQAELAAAYERAPSALVLNYPGRVDAELRASLPFFQMLKRAYHPVARIGGDELCIHLEAPPPRLESCVALPEIELRSAGVKLELHWPAAVEGSELARVQIADLGKKALFADSDEPEARFHPRLWDGAELLFDGLTHPRVKLERLAAARDLRLELRQPLPPELASYCVARFFGPDGRRLVSLPIVITAWR